MKYQKQPNRWSCVPTSFAIVLDVDVNDLIQEVGHDGSEIWWPQAAPPKNRRGFHTQELVEVCLNRGYSVTQIEPIPAVYSPEHEKLNLKNSYKIVSFTVDAKSRMDRIMNNRSGVLTGVTARGNRHAVAWLKDKAVDPTSGQEISIDSFKVQYFYLIGKTDFGLDVKNI